MSTRQKTIRQFGLITAVIFVLTTFAQPVRAEIGWSGDVDPADPVTWTASTYGYIGKTGYGTMDITGGSDVIDKQGYISYSSSSTGEVIVDGVGSTWTNSSNLYVADYGDGTLNITGGGAVSNYSGYIGINSGSTGEVTVDGAGSAWTNRGRLSVGWYGNGTLNITGGGAVSNSSSNSSVAYIGYDSDSTGEVTVDGAGSAWMNSGDLVVASDGDGTLNITGGGTVSSSRGYIGVGSGSTGVVTVDGTGSAWTNSSDLTVGKDGNGTLNITNGGAVSNDEGIIGDWSTGVVTIDGAGSTWTNSSVLFVGGLFGGNGTLNITGGGAVSSDEGVIGSGSTGVVTVDGAGSTWSNSGRLYVSGIFERGDGTLEITDNGLVSVVGTLTIDDDGDGDGYINMATGGMLALFGDADDSLVDFLGLIDGTDAIRYWDDSILDWADITGATYGVDYTLEYLTEGELTSYTMLTVPEPTTLLLLGLGGLILRKRK